MYLSGKKFTLHTDHKPLEPLKKVHVRTLNRLQQLMLEYDFDIVYKPGAENTVPDFLSRNPISSVDIKYEKLVALQSEDELIADLKRDYAADSQDPQFLKLRPFLHLENEILYHISKDGIYRVFAPKSIQSEILQSAHNSLLGGHMGIYKTTQRIINSYFWPSMTHDIELHIKNCLDCQRTKPHSKHARAPLRPLEQPASMNHRIHIDLFGPLATSENGKSYILVITDAFTKYVELVALKNKEAKTVADALMDTWFTRYSTPHEVISDNGKEFCNKLSDELFSRLKIMHKTTSPYHPECNASAEVFNRTMRQYIQAVIQPPYLDWEIYLPALRISYNTSVSKATKKSPFSLVFAMKPQMPFFDFEPEFSYSEDYYDRLAALQKAREEAEKNNLLYKDMYAAQYNARHNVQEPTLSVGDLILVEARPNQNCKNAKLHNLYDGPFPVVRVSVPNVYYQRGKKVYVTHVNRIKKVRTPLRFEQEGRQVALHNSADESARVSLHSPPSPSTPGTARRSGGKGALPPPPRVMHDVEVDAYERDVIPQSTQNVLPPVDLGHVILHDQMPNDVCYDDVILVDNSEGVPIEEQGAAALPPENSDDLGLSVEESLSIRDPETAPFAEAMSRMDDNELSHFYANDQSMVSLHSAPLDGTQQEPQVFFPKPLVDQSSYTKRKLDSSQVSSPPRLPVAKRTPSSPRKSVRQSFSDICLRPSRLLRSRGSAPDVPNIPFPVESQAYRRALGKVLEDESSTDQNNVGPPDVPRP